MNRVQFYSLIVCSLFFALAWAQDLPENAARIHYFRPDGIYDDWQLHVWLDTTEEVTWQDGVDVTGSDTYGAYFDIGLQDGAERVGFIVHKGDDKDPGPDMFLDLGRHGREIWLVSGSDAIYTEVPNLGAVPQGDLGKAQAYWLSTDTLALPRRALPDGVQFVLHSDAEAGLNLADNALTGGRRWALTYVPEGLPADILKTFPHLADYMALRLESLTRVQTAELLQSQLAVSVSDAEGKLLDATSVQLPGVLDDLYSYDGALGIGWQDGQPSLRVWAPTARQVRLHLFGSADDTNPDILPLSRDPQSGVWSISGPPEWRNKYYLYEVTVYTPSTGGIETNLVTDPYSLSLSTNSRRSQIVDLNDPALQPPGWNNLQKPALAAPEDITLYELHLRDFSVSDPSVPEAHRGTYLAFTHPESEGMKHLRRLARAGLSHIHLLPVFDIASIDEDKSGWLEPAGDLSSYGPSSAQQQAAIGEIRDRDGFNWGYDPYHYTVPEGSYATDPEGAVRILEFREMVRSLNHAGLRVVMDVVYNHTNASGQADKSVLDKVVPGYYHRLNKDGRVETSTCCQNTASEHAMMRKLMVDSVLTWAKDYKVDGFRFDLMGHHMVEDMKAVRLALDDLGMERDGVDGESIYVYGEGWNFGEVADGVRGANASQLNIGGLGIGTFNDRLRDAARGGDPFGGWQEQGFVSGLYTDPNDTPQGSEAAQRERLLEFGDLIRVGLTGNLADYPLVNYRGALVPGSAVDYNGSPTGYTQDPQEVVNYVSAHDNETLFDALAYKARQDLPADDRVRMQVLGLSLVSLGQGIPFYHAGSELLRSKSLDRDSYNSGDWFNRLDYSAETNNWAVGLPPAQSNRDNWNLMRPILENPYLQMEPEQIETTSRRLEELLELRMSSPLFRLRSEDEVLARLRFHNTGPEQTPGVIVMELSDEVADRADLDPSLERLVIVFNANPAVTRVTLPSLQGYDLRLHPLQSASADRRLGFSRFNSATGELIVPGLSAVVMLER